MQKYTNMIYMAIGIFFFRERSFLQNSFSTIKEQIAYGIVIGKEENSYISLIRGIFIMGKSISNRWFIHH